MPLNVVVMVSFHKVNSEAQHDTEVLSSPNGVFLSLVSEHNDRIFKFDFSLGEMMTFINLYSHMMIYNQYIYKYTQCLLMFLICTLLILFE